MYVSLFLYSLAFLALFAIAELLYRHFGVKAERTRKFIHITTGLLALGFPVFIEQFYAVVLLCAAFAGILMLSRRYGLLPSIQGVKRKTYGGVLFPLAVVLSFAAYLYYDRTIYYYIPMVILSISDPLAAWAGHRLPMGRYRIFNHWKSWGGTLAFALSAAIIVWILLWIPEAVEQDKLWICALVIGGTTAVIEAVSSRGIDNISIPATAIVSMGVLQHYFGY